MIIENLKFSLKKVKFRIESVEPPDFVDARTEWLIKAGDLQTAGKIEIQTQRVTGHVCEKVVKTFHLVAGSNPYKGCRRE